MISNYSKLTSIPYDPALSWSVGELLKLTAGTTHDVNVISESRVVDGSRDGSSTDGDRDMVVMKSLIHYRYLLNKNVKQNMRKQISRRTPTNILKKHPLPCAIICEVLAFPLSSWMICTSPSPMLIHLIICQSPPSHTRPNAFVKSAILLRSSRKYCKCFAIMNLFCNNCTFQHHHLPHTHPHPHRCV